MDARPLTPTLTVCPQIEPADLQRLSKAGFRAILCNRPDGEADDQPTFAEIEAAAADAGLSARYLPVAPGRITDDDATSFAEMMADLPAPILAYCRTGTRSATLWALAAAETRPLTDILAAAQRAGYDLSDLTPRLANRMTGTATASN